MDYYFSSINKEKACEILKSIVSRNIVLKTEERSIYDANNTFLSKNYYSKQTSPPTHVSAMDGYAVNAQDTFEATETKPKKIENFIRVQTGESISQYNCVIPFEEVREEQNAIFIYSSYFQYQNVRKKGEDILKEDCIAKKGQEVNNFDLALLKIGGFKSVEIYKLPKVLFIPTGDELTHDLLQENQLAEFNSVIFKNLMDQYHFDVEIHDIIKNNPKHIEEVIRKNIENYDIIFINAGSSKGDFDFTADVLNKVGKIYCHGIAIKPGRPTIISEVENKLVMGLPGYPVSMFFSLKEVFLKGFFEAFSLYPKLNTIYARLERIVSSSPDVDEFIRVKIENKNGENVANVLKRGASAINSLRQANGYFVIPINVDFIDSGEIVEVQLI